MAKRQEIYSLFNLKSPEQVEAERRAEAERFFNTMQTGHSRLGGALGMALGGMFAPESEEMRKARQAEEIIQGSFGAGDGEIARMAAMANRFVEAKMPGAASAALKELQRLKDLEAKRRDDAAKAERAETESKRGRYERRNVTRRIPIGTVDPITGKQQYVTVTDVYQIDKDNPDADPVLLISGRPEGAGGADTGVVQTVTDDGMSSSEQRVRAGSKQTWATTEIGQEYTFPNGMVLERTGPGDNDFKVIKSLNDVKTQTEEDQINPFAIN